MMGLDWRGFFRVIIDWREMIWPRFGEMSGYVGEEGRRVASRDMVMSPALLIPDFGR